MKCLAQEHITMFPARPGTRTDHDAPHIPEEKKSSESRGYCVFSNGDIGLMLLIEYKDLQKSC